MVKGYELQPKEVRDVSPLDDRMEGHVARIAVPRYRQLLTPDQLERLEQLNRYRMGLELYEQPEYARYLGLSHLQKTKVYEMKLTCDSWGKESDETDEIKTKLEEKAITHEIECLHQVFDVLSSEQKRRLTHLIGARKIDLWTLNKQVRQQRIDVNTLGWNIVFE